MIPLQDRIDNAIDIALSYGTIDGGHHKMWVIDQMVRELCENEENYNRLIKEYQNGIDGPNTYEWQIGIPP